MLQRASSVSLKLIQSSKVVVCVNHAATCRLQIVFYSSGPITLLLPYRPQVEPSHRTIALILYCLLVVARRVIQSRLLLQQATEVDVSFKLIRISGDKLLISLHSFPRLLILKSDRFIEHLVEARIGTIDVVHCLRPRSTFEG